MSESFSREPGLERVDDRAALLLADGTAFIGDSARGSPLSIR